MIIVSALSLSLRDKERFRDWEIERAWQYAQPKNKWSWRQINILKVEISSQEAYTFKIRNSSKQGGCQSQKVIYFE